MKGITHSPKFITISAIVRNRSLVVFMEGKYLANRATSVDWERTKNSQIKCKKMEESLAIAPVVAPIHV